jgi:Prophage antirepressor
MSQALTFQSTTFDVIDRNGEPWVRGSQVGNALGYTNGGKKIYELYHRHADEFNESMAGTIELMVGNAKQEVLIFSLRGCHLLAMFARTSVAKAFRVWVLDVLETLNTVQERQAPTIDTNTRLSKRGDPERKELHAIVNTWVGCAPLHYAAANAIVAAHIGVKGVDEMTIGQVKTAISFVRGKIAEATQPAIPVPLAPTDEDELERYYGAMCRLVDEFRALDQGMHAILDRAAGRYMTRLDARRSFAVANLHAATSMGNALGHMLDAMKHHAQAVLRAERL